MSNRHPQSAVLVVCLAILLVPLTAVAGSWKGGWKGKGMGKFCSATAQAAFSSCRSQTRDDLATALGICTNVSDPGERSQCLSDAKDSTREADQLCKDQRSARLDVCDAIGEARYEPSFDPADFDSDFDHLTHPNPYFPLAIGNRWTYSTGSEVDTVTLRNATKQIEGVTCLVAHDVVTDDGDLTEDTNDWFAQAKSGDVDYCGEEAKQYESFDGDDPREPELVGNEGSFKAGREGAQPGTLFLAAPSVGVTYRQEFDLGNAEDVSQVLSTTYSYGHDADLDANVPAALAQLLCSAGDCVVTRDFSPLEPDVVERKYYAKGIGDFLELDLSSGDVTQLVECNFDARCAMLPTP
jgi:hypothetical protein